MKNCSRTVVLLAFALGIFPAAQAPLFAQSDSNAAPKPRARRRSAGGDQGEQPPKPLLLSNYLEQLRYDVSERGPLIVVVPDQPLTESRTQSQTAVPGAMSLGAIARLFARRSVTIGSITALAPANMKVIETDPGKANPLLGMRPSEILKLLMGTFTREQWQTACGDNGIGFVDLTANQKQLFDRLLPTDIRIQKSTIAEGPTTGSITFSNAEIVDVADRSSVRIRFNREVSLLLRAVGTNSLYMGGAPDYKPGATMIQMLPARAFGADGGGEEAESTAYGVLLLKKVANRQKTSQLDYASTSLDARVPLTGLTEKSTVGQLIDRVSTATRLHVIADHRVRDLLVSALGGEARAGDILQAIALSVTGTYRKVGPPPSTYLLTDDIEGIGTRLTRLEIWAQQAEEMRRRLIDDATAQAAKQNPVGFIKFSADDKLALPEDTARQIEDRYRTDPYSQPETHTSDLTPALRDEVKRDIDAWQRSPGVVLDPSKVTIGMQMTPSYIIPNVGAVKDIYSNLNTGMNSLSTLAFTPKPSGAGVRPKAPETAAAEWLKTPSQPQRRVLVCSPATAEESARFVREAALRGFNEVWIRIALDGRGATAQEIVKSAADAGAPAKISICPLISLLRSQGGSGVPEHNILGQTGAEFSKAYVDLEAASATAESPVDGDALTRATDQHFAGWIDPDGDELRRRVLAIAGLPNIGGLALDATAPPGFVRQRQEYASSVLIGGEMGFTDRRRSAFLAKNGLDPIDIRDVNSVLLSVKLSLPFFPDDGQARHLTYSDGQMIEDTSYHSPHSLWDDFRSAENQALLRSVYLSVRGVRPNLPLFIDDRTSDFTSANTSWFGSWDLPTVLPANEPYADPGGAPALARSASKVTLLSANVPDLNISDDPYALAGFLNRVAGRAALRWSGVLFDISHFAAAKAFDLLDSLALPKTDH